MATEDGVVKSLRSGMSAMLAGMRHSAASSATAMLTPRLPVAANTRKEPAKRRAGTP